jgi:hypothetical protein
LAEQAADAAAHKRRWVAGRVGWWWWWGGGGAGDVACRQLQWDECILGSTAST